MKPCIGCRKQFTDSQCPGHVEATGIEDHCRACVDAGKCIPIAHEFPAPDFDPCGEPGDIFVDGYRVHNNL